MNVVDGLLLFCACWWAICATLRLLEAREEIERLRHDLERQMTIANEMLNENERHRKWFEDNAGVLAVHRIGGFEFTE